MGEQDTQVAATAAEGVPDEPMFEALAVHVRHVFEENARHRRVSGIEDKLSKCLRLSKCEYTAAEKQLFAQKGAPEIFMPIADMKRRAAMAMFGEIFSNPGDKPWTLAPTPVPDVPEEVTQKAVAITMRDYMAYAQATGVAPDPQTAFFYAQDRMTELLNEEAEWAKIRALLMERHVHDGMIEGGWLEAFEAYRSYLCTYGTAVIKGPVPRIMLKKRAKRTKSGTKYEMQEAVALTYEAVSPWDCFPSKGARKIDQGDFCIRVKFTPQDLNMFAKMKGKEWRRDNVIDILTRHPRGGVWIDLAGENERRKMENSEPDLGDQCVLEAIEYYGEVRGSYLTELGFDRDADNRRIDDEEYYEVKAIVCDNMVVYCKITEPQIGRMVSKGVFYSVPDSWWGDSILEKCESTQKLCNAAVRDLVVNMAQSSGPQTVIKDISRLHPSCSTAQSPWKVWLFQNSVMGQSDNPLHVFQPDSNIRELLMVFDWAMKQADNDTGIPAYTYGAATAGGAGRTSSGLAMLIENVNRGIKMVVTSTDADVVRTTVKRTADWLMLYGDDESIKGDTEVNPSGVMSLVFRENGSIRRRAFLQLLANPLVAQAVLPSGVAAIIREEARALDVNPDDIVPSREKLKEMDDIAQVQRQLQLAQSIANAQAAGNEAQQPQGTPVEGLQQSEGQPPQGVNENPQRNAMSGALRVSQGGIGGEQ
jgi:hypothetical protein